MREIGVVRWFYMEKGMVLSHRTTTDTLIYRGALLFDLFQSYIISLRRNGGIWISLYILGKVERRPFLLF